MSPLQRLVSFVAEVPTRLLVEDGVAADDIECTSLRTTREAMSMRRVSATDGGRPGGSIKGARCAVHLALSEEHIKGRDEGSRL